MAAKIVTLAEAVKDLINDADITDCPVAERVLVSRYDTMEENDFAVDVRLGEPRGFERLARRSWTDTPAIDVLVYKKIAGNLTKESANAEGDRVVELMEKIAEMLLATNSVG